MAENLITNAGLELADETPRALRVIPVDSAGSSGVLPVSGNSAAVVVEKTRPSDANVYAANDAIAESTSAGTVWTFTNVLRVAAGGGTVVRAMVATDQVANVATYRLYLYSAAPTAINDNAECTYLYANNATYLGKIDFPAPVKDSANSTAAKIELSGALLPIPAGLAAGRTIYGLLSTPLGFTPASGQKVSVTLEVAQD